jgi:inorganic pyrophosphatase
MAVDFERLPIGEDAPQVVNVVVEVPVGSRNKYEYKRELGVIVRDRVLPGSVRYPIDYGFVPSTVGNDGDPLTSYLPLMTRHFRAALCRVARLVLWICVMPKDRTPKSLLSQKTTRASRISEQLQMCQNRIYARLNSSSEFTSSSRVTRMWRSEAGSIEMRLVS